MDNQPLAAEQKVELGELAANLNNTLASAASSSAERAFGIGCGLGLIPVVAAAVILFALGVINLIIAAILAVMSLLFLIGFSSLLASVARANTVKRTYQSEVLPSIEKYLAETGINRVEFDTRAAEYLPQEAPLQEFLSPIRRVENDSD